ncbi:MAG: tandem-95 repeat protein [Anaerolineae bacterium]|nr:tandem-95 repeat protein [Anaerolineae bacterium]
MFTKLKHKLEHRKQLAFSREKGQSLVEMAIITPLLLLLFIGVFEVGWALRGYLVLTSMNRESTRFAIKNGVLNYSVKDPTTVGYDIVLSHTLNSMAEQLPLDFDAGTSNATVIMSHFVIDTGYPCVKYQGGDPVVPYEFNPTCNCNESNPDHPQWFTKDDLILHPDTPGYAYYAQTYGVHQDTRLGGGDYATVAKQLALENNQMNCNVLKTGTAGELSSNNMIITEAFYEQPQLLSVPFISNALTDPIPFYTHTAMRIVASRDADTTNTVGPTCELLPITFPEDALAGDPDDPPEQKIDAYEGSASGNFGWIYWNSNINETKGINYIEESLANPRLSMTDFTADEDDPDHPNDHTINIGDWVAGRTGVGNNNDIEDLLESYRGKTVLIPVYKQVGPKGGAKASYEISHFARVVIDEICLPRNNCIDPNTGKKISGSNKLIRATFLYYDDEACSDGSEVGGGGGGNNPPVAVDDAIATPKNTPVIINVLNNDSDPDGNPLTIDSLTQPAKGTAVNNGDGTITYTPKNNNVGSYQFTYTISDGHGGTAAATVTVTVGGTNAPPVAVDDSASTEEDTSVTIDVLGNDSDPDGDTLIVDSVGAPGHGSVVNNGNGTITYTPNAGFTGTDSFTYSINDDNDGVATATVTVTVNPANRPPVAVNDNATTDQTVAVVINVLNNDSDPDGDALAVDSVTLPGNGSVVDHGNGTVTYTPNGNFNGTDTFNYTISDGRGGTATAQVSVTVIPNNPPVAGDDSATTNKRLAVTIDIGSNDSDIDGDAPLIFSDFSTPTANGGTVMYNGNGSVTYTPAFNFTGADTFTYLVSDGKGGSDVGTVTVDVQQPAIVYVQSIDVRVVSYSRNRYRGIADITVVDGNGAPIRNATVEGTWSGPQPGSGLDTTNYSGVATVQTARTRNATGTYTFCVDNINMSGYTYEAGENIETCDSGSS